MNEQVLLSRAFWRRDEYDWAIDFILRLEEDPDFHDPTAEFFKDFKKAIKIFIEGTPTHVGVFYEYGAPNYRGYDFRDFAGYFYLYCYFELDNSYIVPSYVFSEKIRLNEYTREYSSAYGFHVFGKFSIKFITTMAFGDGDLGGDDTFDKYEDSPLKMPMYSYLPRIIEKDGKFGYYNLPSNWNYDWNLGFSLFLIDNFASYWEDEDDEVVQEYESLMIHGSKVKDELLEIFKKVDEVLENELKGVEQRQELKSEINKIKSEIAKADSNINSLGTNITDMDKKIQALERKIFGKDKARQEILSIKKQQESLKEELTKTRTDRYESLSTLTKLVEKLEAIGGSAETETEEISDYTRFALNRMLYKWLRENNGFIKYKWVE